MGFYKCWIIESLYTRPISEKHQRQKEVPDKVWYNILWLYKQNESIHQEKYGLNKTCQFVAQIMSHFILFISPNSSVLNTKHKCSI